MQKMTLSGVFKALSEGKKVRKTHWEKTEYMQIVDNKLVEYDDDSRKILDVGEIIVDDEAIWELYTELLTTKEKQIIDYAKSHYDEMWAATILGIIFGCSFRDVGAELKNRGLI